MSLCRIYRCPKIKRICYRKMAAVIKYVKYFVCIITIMELIVVTIRLKESQYSMKVLYGVPTPTPDDTTHYLVKSPVCHIPDLYNQTLHLIGDEPFEVDCSLGPELTETEGLFLILHKDRVGQYNMTMEDLNCNYKNIIAIGVTRHRLSKAIELTSSRTRIYEEGVLVVCSQKGNNAEVIYQNIHTFIQPHLVEEKRKKFKMENGERGLEPEKLSVVVMGLDSMSRGALMRFMPKTYQYLTQDLKAFDFQGNNKVGHNTDPNLMATLIGMNYYKPQWCREDKRSAFDRCPLIWKNFSANGYATVHMEDFITWGIFHYIKKGFQIKPTDYYFMPFLKAYLTKLIYYKGKKVAHKPLKLLNAAHCLGNKKTITVILEHALKVAESLQDIPYFGFYFSGSITHNAMRRATAVDDPTLRYLKAMKENKFLDHTILFLMSDHGMRHGTFRATYPGMLEENMPYFLAVFPQWLREKHSHIFKHMAINTKKLISHFDHYATLIDIAYGTYRDHSKTPVPPTEYGISLFREIPMNRTCESAMIPENLCSCGVSRDVSLHDPVLKQASRYVVDVLNTGLQEFPKCAQLVLQKVLGGRLSYPNNANIAQESSTYTVSLMTYPGNATMEAKVRYVKSNFTLLGEVSRTNLYGNQSHCIEHDIYRQYCFCKDLLYSVS